MLYLTQDLIKRNKYFFLSRSRRFGKSIFVDTLESFYSNKRSLFNNTYIYNQLPESSWIGYPIFRLDFSVIDNANSNIFQAKFIAALQQIADSYELKINDNSIGYLTKNILISLKKKFGLGVVVLIDEYDAPYTAHHPDSNNAQEIFLTLKTFYSTLKSESKSIHFCFFTGVTRVMLTSASSGFSSYIDITFMDEFGDIVGFTKNELKQYFQQHIDNVALIKNTTSEEIYQEMKLWFDGYKFACDGERVYNPCSVIEYLHSKGENKQFWISTAESSFLREKLNAFPIYALKTIIRLHENDISNPRISTTPSLQLPSYLFESRCDLRVQTFDTLLLILVYHGYLSIDTCIPKAGNIVYSLKFPNYEVQTDYVNQIPSLLVADRIETLSLRKNVEDATECLTSHKWAEFIDKVNSVIAKMPNTMFSDHTVVTKEKLFQIIYQLIMIFGDFNSVDVEEMTSLGRADVVVENRNDIFITELKLEHNKEENPLDQCSTKYAPKFLEGGKEITCIAVIISVTERRITKWGVHRYSENGDFLQQQGELKGIHTVKINSFTTKLKNY